MSKILKIISTICFILVLLVEPAAKSAPAQVFIIRHGEKPEFGNDLDFQGYQRAAGLANFFENTPELKKFGLPVAIFAMAPSSDDPSKRPIETVTPLANALGIQINTSFSKLQLQPMVSQIMQNAAYDNKALLICWEHKMMPYLARDFGASGAPFNWEDNVFNQVWILSFTGSGMTQFKSILENILPSDSLLLKWR